MDICRHIEAIEKYKVDRSQHHNRKEIWIARYRDKMAKLYLPLKRKSNSNIQPSRGYILSWRIATSSIARHLYRNYSFNEATQSVEASVGNSKLKSMELVDNLKSALKILSSSSQRNSSQFGNTSRQAQVSSNLKANINTNSGVTYSNRSNNVSFSNVNFKQHDGLNDHQEIRRDSPDESLLKLLNIKSSVVSVKSHSSASSSSSVYQEDYYHNRTYSKSYKSENIPRKKLKDFGERDLKPETVMFNHHRHRTSVRHNSNRTSYRKHKHKTLLLQTRKKVVFGRKLRRLFEDLQSLLLYRRDRQMMETLLKGLNKQLKNNRKGDMKYREKGIKNRGHNGKDRSGKGHNSNSRRVKGRRIVQKYTLRTEKRPKGTNKHIETSVSLNYHDLAKYKYEKNDLLKYILAQNILRSGWPLLSQQRNGSGFNKLFDILRKRLASIPKETSDMDAKSKVMSQSELMKVTYRIMNASASLIPNSSVSPIPLSYDENSTQNHTFSNLVQPSYKVKSSELTKTPYLAARYDLRASSHKLSPTNVEESSNLNQISSPYIQRVLTTKTQELFELTGSLAHTSTDSVLRYTQQNNEKESIALPLKFSTYSYASEITTVLNNSSYFSSNLTTDVRLFKALIFKTMNMAISSNSVSLNTRTVANKDAISISTEMNKDIFSPDEDLVSDLIAAYNFALEERLSHSYRQYATINKSPITTEMLDISSLTLKNSFIPITSYKIESSLNFDSSALVTPLSSSTTKIDKNSLPLIDEEASSPLDEMQIASKSEMKDSIDLPNKTVNFPNSVDGELFLLQNIIRFVALRSKWSRQQSTSSILPTKTYAHVDVRAMSSSPLLNSNSSVGNSKNYKDEEANSKPQASKTSSEGKFEDSTTKEINVKLKGMRFRAYLLVSNNHAVFSEYSNFHCAKI